MTKDTTKEAAVAAEGLLFDDWFDGIEDGVRLSGARVHSDDAGSGTFRGVARPRYGRRRLGEDEATPSVVGVRHGHRERTLTGTFGKTRIAVPRARLIGEDGEARMAERFAARLPAPHPGRRRLDRRGLSRRDQYPPRATRVERGVCRAGRQGRGQPRLAQDEERLGRLECALARRRADRAADPRRDGRARSARQKATSISLLVGLGVRADGQKVLLAIKSMGGESEAAWRALLDDLIRRGLRTPELVVVDGAPGLEKALAALWPDMAVQRCTVHKHRNLHAHAPERLHEEISINRDMIYAATRGEVETRRKAFIRKWRLKCRAVADSLEEVGDKLFTFTQFPPSQWKSIRTSNAIERLHEEFKRRIRTQTVLPCAETAAMLFWALLTSGQITMRKVDGWQTLAEKPDNQIIDLAA